jgi:hypothetical protein
MLKCSFDNFINGSWRNSMGFKLKRETDIAPESYICCTGRKATKSNENNSRPLMRHCPHGNNEHRGKPIWMAEWRIKCAYIYATQISVWYLLLFLKNITLVGRITYVLVYQNRVNIQLHFRDVWREFCCCIALWFKRVVSGKSGVKHEFEILCVALNN